MSADTRTFSQEDVDQIVQDRIARERRSRSSDTHVVTEPRVYALDSPYSYFGDLGAVATDPHGTTHPGAQQRLQRYAVELGQEMHRGTPEGRRAERIIHEHARVEDPIEHERRAQSWIRETRALGTGGGITAAATSGASAFVPPVFVLDEWALFRGAVRAFADQCHQLPLPPFGMQVYVPAFTSTDSAGIQSAEGAGVAETDPSTALQSGSVQTVTGQMTITQQLDDRGFGMGGAIDRLIGLQLRQQLDSAIDVYTIQQALAAGAAISGASTYSTANLYQDIATGRERLTDTAGTRLKPTHLFTTSDLYSYATRQVDAQGRPILNPQFAPGYNPMVDVNGQEGQPAPKWAQFSGTILPGGLYWFTDDNIPASGADTQIIVSAPEQAVLLLESPQPVLSVWPQTVAQNLEIVLNLRKYVAVVARHASGTVAISGAAYPTTAV